MKVIFLDIDGVLNACGAPDFDPSWGPQFDGEAMHRLSRLVRDTDARVVISSTWRYLLISGHMSYFGVEVLFRSHGALAFEAKVGIPWNQRIISHIGPVTDDSGILRGQYIHWWLTMNSAEAHVVLDDMDWGISKAGLNFVHVDQRVGLSEADVERAICYLSPRR